MLRVNIIMTEYKWIKYEISKELLGSQIEQVAVSTVQKRNWNWKDSAIYELKISCKTLMLYTQALY